MKNGMRNQAIPNMSIETKKQISVEMALRPKPCIPAMETPNPICVDCTILIFLTAQSAGSLTKSCQSKKMAGTSLGRSVCCSFYGCNSQNSEPVTGESMVIIAIWKSILKNI